MNNKNAKYDLRPLDISKWGEMLRISSRLPKIAIEMFIRSIKRNNVANELGIYGPAWSSKN